MPPGPPITANSPFLSDVLEALRRRRRALKHQNALPEIERIIEIEEGVAQERLEIRMAPRKRQRLGLIVRQDRTIRVQATESIAKAGWKFEFADQGRLVAQTDGRAFVAALEASLSAMFEMTADQMDRLERVWNPLIAKGPRSL